MASNTVNKTKSVSLQTQLETWSQLLSTAINAGPHASEARNVVINQFSRCFVPVEDITEDDIEYFSSNLCCDEDYLLGIKRDIEQCASGLGVESIKGNQKSRAIFTLTPPPGTCMSK